MVLHYCQPRECGAFSWDFTTILAPESWAFSRALKIEKLKGPLITGPLGAVDTNDWCISHNCLLGRCCIAGHGVTFISLLKKNFPLRLIQEELVVSYWLKNGYLIHVLVNCLW